MAHPHAARRTVCAFVPPMLLVEIARRGDDEQRDRALATLARDASIRTFRVQAAAGAAPRRARPELMARRGRPERLILDLAGSEDPSGARMARSEGDPGGEDVAVDEAYDGLGATWTLLADAYDRDSIDDAGMRLEGWVHFGRDYDNAFWDGRRMVFGDGDGRLFNRFTAAVDVIGHELAHGVVEHEAGLEYVGESGALNESLADVFGSLVKQHARGERAEDADWLIGAELLAPGVQGRALRDMREPGTAYDDPVLGRDRQPGHMDGFVRTTDDNGGVHINSGIPNRAFATAALALGGWAWERAGRVWYETLRDPRLRPSSGFEEFARVTLAVARRLFGEGEELDAVEEGWRTVGVRAGRARV